MRLTLEGTLREDGSIVYVDGMDLADILKVAIPGGPDPHYQGAYDHPGRYVVTVEKTS